MALIEAIAPTLLNAGSTLLNNAFNRSYYSRMQDKANAFAVQERLAAQDYNSPANQLRLMQEAGMNPNLLTGTAFEATSPVQNQSVSPPMGEAPQAPAVDVTSARLNEANARKSAEEAVTVDSLREGLVKVQNATFDFVVKQTERIEEEIPAIRKQVDLIAEQCNALQKSASLSDAQAQNVRENTRKTQQEIQAYSKLWRAQYNEIASRISVNSAQREFLLANKDNILALTEGVKFQNDLNNDGRTYLLQGIFNNWQEGVARIKLMRAQEKLFNFELGQQHTFSSLHHSMQLLNEALKAVKAFDDLNPARQGYKAGLNMLGGKIGDSMDFNSPSVAPAGFGSSWNSSVSY